MLVVCVLSFVISLDGIGFLVKDNVEGKVISKSETKYLIDFTKGLKKFPLTRDPQDYKEVLIDKTECVKK